MTETRILERREIRAVFRRHRGTAYRLAAEIGLSRTTVSQWLRGRITSRKVADAAQTRALELLRAEEAAGKGAAA